MATLLSGRHRESVVFGFVEGRPEAREGLEDLVLVSNGTHYSSGHILLDPVEIMLSLFHRADMYTLHGKTARRQDA